MDIFKVAFIMRKGVAANDCTGLHLWITSHKGFVIFGYVLNIMVSVNGHRKQQLSYTENQQTLFLFPIFIDARLTYDQKIRMSSQSTTSYAILKCLSSGGPLPPVRNRATPSP